MLYHLTKQTKPNQIKPKPTKLSIKPFFAQLGLFRKLGLPFGPHQTVVQTSSIFVINLMYSYVLLEVMLQRRQMVFNLRLS